MTTDGEPQDLADEHASTQLTADLCGHLFKETSVSAMNKLALRGAKAVTNLDGTEG
jgi:hypothetical protein